MVKNNSGIEMIAEGSDFERHIFIQEVNYLWT